MYTVETEVGVLKIKPQERNQRVYVEKKRKFTGDLYRCMYTVQVQVKDGKEAVADPHTFLNFATCWKKTWHYRQVQKVRKKKKQQLKREEKSKLMFDKE